MRKVSSRAAMWREKIIGIKCMENEALGYLVVL
jgi:hypothetical protein